MAAADFDDFCEQVCGLLDLEPPVLTCDMDGRRAFTITHCNAEFSFIERRTRRSEGLSMLVKFGVPPQDRAPEIMANLMGVNFQMTQKGGAAFVQLAETGDIFLHRQADLAQLHVPAVRNFVDKFALHVARWSRDYFLDDGKSHSSSGELSFANLA